MTLNEKSLTIVKSLENELNIEFRSAKELFRNIEYKVDVDGNIVSLMMQGCEIKTLNRIIGMISKIETLTYLDLSNNNLQSVALLGHIASLEKINISNNNVRDLRMLRKLPNINSLDLSANPIKKLDYINEIEGLKELVLDECINVNFNDLKNYNIENLSVSNLKSSYTAKNLDVSFLKNFKKLKGLDISRNIINFDAFVENKNLVSLNISNTKIEDLKELSKFPNLELLYMSNNLVKNIDNLPLFENLEVLSIDHTGLSTIGRLSVYKKLKKLRILKNNISDFSPISELTNLETIVANDNNVSCLDDFVKLKNLKVLFLGNNQISDISLISELKLLEELNLGDNDITNISPLKHLQKLKLLFLYKNKIKNINALKSYKYIEKLWLSENLIEELPLWLTNLGEGVSIGWGTENDISVEDNPIHTPPIEIVKQGSLAIKNYYKQLQDQQEEYLFEAKLLIIGEPGAGKTSMSWKIENSDCELPIEDDTTKGIEVKQYYFPLRAEDFPNFKKPEKLQNKSFRINLWDFGGQEIYKATHRFFLSKRSLYTLVTDSRNEDTDFNYWLHIVEMFGGNSPLLIVVNEKHRRKRMVDIESMRERFRNIVSVVDVNFTEPEKDRLNNLLKEIRHYTTKLEHIGSPVPSTWAQVRYAIESNPNNVISLQDYLSLCRASGIEQVSDALLLSQYFHDIGVFLHFQDDDLLKNVIFIKANWATNSVYKILDHELLNDQDGRFSKEDVNTIWIGEEYELIKSELIQLMKKFFLAYEITKTGQYIVPERLPNYQPKYNWNSESNMHLRYQYGYFMPKGILSQFIIQMHHFIDNHSYVWRRGVILRRNETFAEVIESYDTRRLKIRLYGKDKRDFLTIITNEIDKINGLYEKIEVQKMIPCICGFCINQYGEPYFHEHDELKRRIMFNKEEAECKVSFKMVKVKNLIDDVLYQENQKDQKHEDMLTAKDTNNEFSSKTKIFISYSHDDKKWLDRIQSKFKALINVGIEIDPWDDTRLKIGDIWKKEIKKAIDEADVAVLLISDSFFSSDFIMGKELPPLLEAAKKSGCIIVPIIVRPSVYSMHDELSNIQSFNPPSKALSEMSAPQKDRYLVNLVTQIADLIKNKKTM